MQTVVTCLLATGILPKAPTIPPDLEQEGLSYDAFDTRSTDGTTDKSNLAPTIAPVVTRKGKQRMFHHPQHLKSQDNPHLQHHQERCQPQHVRHHPHGLERGNKGTRAHRNRVSHSSDRHVCPGVARTTELMQRKYHWTSLKSEARDYVHSCGCRRLKRPTSQRVAMLPARFLKPWEVLEMDIHDMGTRSEAGNRHLLVIVDRASKVLFAYPLPNKTAESVAKKILELLLTFGIPLSLRSDPGTEFTAEVVRHICKWLNVAIDYGPTDHSRAQGAVERLGGWIHETLVELSKSWPRRWDEYVQPALWLHRTTPDPRLPSKTTPSACYSAVAAEPRWTLPHLVPTTRAWTDYITSSLTRVKTSVKCRKSTKNYSTVMSRDASNEST